MVITTLVTAYQRNSISDFEDILRAHQDKLVEDTFIREYIEDLLKNIRTQVLLNIIQPYTKIHIPFISGKLRIRESDVESLLVSPCVRFSHPCTNRSNQSASRAESRPEPMFRV